MTAVLFGSIGTLADTSELQRASFNEAFTEHGLDWNWSQSEYQGLLSESGGAKRIAAYAREKGVEVDADAVHATKSAIFQRRLREGSTEVRPEVAKTIEAARAAGVKVALVTTTSPDNLAALGEALSPQVDLGSFDLVLSTEDVENAKPAPDVYRLALERLGEEPDNVVAIEDNVGGVSAAVAAGVRCIGFPGENNAGHDFGQAERTVEALRPDDVPVLAA